MQIIILGAGQVGSGMARSLSAEDFDITVVDLDADLLRELQDRLDIRTVHGLASHPEALMRAGIEDAEMLVALTYSDETNIVTCQVTHTLLIRSNRISGILAADA